MSAQENDNAGNNTGHAKLYKYDGNDWQPVQISRGDGYELNGEAEGNKFGNSGKSGFCCLVLSECTIVF